MLKKIYLNDKPAYFINKNWQIMIVKIEEILKYTQNIKVQIFARVIY